MDDHTSERQSASTVCLTVSRNPDLLRRKVADFQRELIREAQTLIAECLEQALSEIDRALEECLVVPRLRIVLPPGTPPRVVEAVKESLRQRAANVWQEDRRVARANAEYAHRRMRVPAPITQPVVTPVTTSSSAPPAPRTTERTLVLR